MILPYLERMPKKPIEGVVILLHGLGATNDDLLPVANFLIDAQLPLRVIIPQAPIRSVTLNAGMSMPAWYDVFGLTEDTKEDHEGIPKAATSIQQLIHHVYESGIDYQRIFLAGFSQGGALAIYTGLRFPKKLGGIIALSTYLALAPKLAEEFHAEQAQIPIFLAHGHSDNVLPFSWGEFSRESLSQLGCEVEWRSYPIAHQISQPELVDVIHWLKLQLKINP